MDKSNIVYSKAVQKALQENLPIVALESTIISHGLSYPNNIEMAKTVERIIKENGSTPATIAIIEGNIHVGLSSAQLNVLASSDEVVKVSTKDIAMTMVKKQTGATTVAATMKIAALVGIDIFATGGIGGVHRGASETFDISHDLEALAQYPITVVCAGAKSILDLGKTLEYLETKGVEVIGYKTEVLPAFYTQESDFKVPQSTEDLKTIAEMMMLKRTLDDNTGIVLANPIPASSALDYEWISKLIDEAIASAEKNGITGKAVTPYLLKRIAQKSDGKALKANLSLVYNNALIAAKLSVLTQTLKAKNL